MEVLMLKVWVLVFFKWAVAESDTIVEVEYGQGVITGFRHKKVNAKPFYSFKGIPYARPPVGDLRFMDPDGDVSWTGKRRGNFDPPRCPQFVDSKFVGEEDCLYLNLFTPQPGNQGYPVMVYIHGGDFINGGAGDYSPFPLLYQDVVLVVLQYRLGILGFLSAEDETLPGNLGLKDQTMALKWVHDNIEKFGGDKDKVTLFGSGSGGASVHYQILTPYAEGYFSRAIIQSGSSLCPRTLRNHHAFVATKLMEQFSCHTVDELGFVNFSQQLLNCLKSVPVENITASYREFLEWESLPLLNVPRVDGDFIPDHPAVLLKEGRYNKVDLLVGFNAHEGNVVTSSLYSYPLAMEHFREDFISIGSLTMGFDEEEHPATLTGYSYAMYIRTLNTRELEGADRLTKLYTDRLFGVCIHDMIDLHAGNIDRNESIYFYQLVHKGGKSLCSDVNNPFDDHWVCHGDEVMYLFDEAFGSEPLEREDDLNLRSIFVTLWTNFAAYGNPTPEETMGILWEPYTKETQEQLLLKPSPLLGTALGYHKTRLYWHSRSFGVNNYLFPSEVGQTVDLTFGNEEVVEEFDSLHEPVYKPVLDDNGMGTKNQESEVNKFVNKSLLVDPTDLFGTLDDDCDEGLVPEVLEAANELSSTNVHPGHEKNRFLDGEQEENNACEISSVSAGNHFLLSETLYDKKNALPSAKVVTKLTHSVSKRGSKTTSDPDGVEGCATTANSDEMLLSATTVNSGEVVRSASMSDPDEVDGCATTADRRVADVVSENTANIKEGVHLVADTTEDPSGVSLESETTANHHEVVDLASEISMDQHKVADLNSETTADPKEVNLKSETTADQEVVDVASETTMAQEGVVDLVSESIEHPSKVNLDFEITADEDEVVDLASKTTIKKNEVNLASETTTGKDEVVDLDSEPTVNPVEVTLASKVTTDDNELVNLASEATTDQDETADLKAFDAIAAGLFNASLTYKGRSENGDDLTFVVGKGNLNEAVSAYGGVVTDFLKEIKMAPDRLDYIKEQRMKPSEVPQNALPGLNEELLGLKEEEWELSPYTEQSMKHTLVPQKALPGLKEELFGLKEEERELSPNTEQRMKHTVVPQRALSDLKEKILGLKGEEWELSPVPQRALSGLKEKILGLKGEEWELSPSRELRMEHSGAPLKASPGLKEELPGLKVQERELPPNSKVELLSDDKQITKKKEIIYVKVQYLPPSGKLMTAAPKLDSSGGS